MKTKRQRRIKSSQVSEVCVLLLSSKQNNSRQIGLTPSTTYSKPHYIHVTGRKVCPRIRSGQAFGLWWGSWWFVESPVDDWVGRGMFSKSADFFLGVENMIWRHWWVVPWRGFEECRKLPPTQVSLSVWKLSANLESVTCLTFSCSLCHFNRFLLVSILISDPFFAHLIATIN